MEDADKAELARLANLALDEAKLVSTEIIVEDSNPTSEGWRGRTYIRVTGEEFRPFEKCHLASGMPVVFCDNSEEYQYGGRAECKEFFYRYLSRDGQRSPIVELIIPTKNLEELSSSGNVRVRETFLGGRSTNFIEPSDSRFERLKKLIDS